MKHSPGFLTIVDDAKQRVTECTVHEVAEQIDQGVRFEFIDVREDNEYQKDHCAGSRHLGRGILERDIEELIPDKSAPIVLYCGGGYRSALAADSIQKMGYDNVRSMAGGIRAWREAELPLES